MPPRKDLKKQKEKISQALIKAGLELSSEEGYASLSLRSVARKAGIAPTSFYRHFREIDEMGVEMVAQAKVVLDEWLVNAQKKMAFPENKKPESHAHLLKALQSLTRPFVETFFAAAGKNHQLVHLFFQEKTGSAEELKTAIGRAYEQLTHDLAEILTRLSLSAKRPLGDAALLAGTMLTIVSSSAMEVITNPEIKSGVAAPRTIEKLNLLLLGALVHEQQRQGGANE